MSRPSSKVRALALLSTLAPLALLATLATLAPFGLATPARAQTAPARTPASPAVAAKVGPVTLLRPGKAPLAPLRLELSRTAVEKAEFSFSMSAQMDTPNGPQKMALPEMTLSATATHAASETAGSIVLRFSLGTLRFEGPNADAANAKIKNFALERVGFEAVVTSRGLVTRSREILGPEVPPDLRQVLDQMKSVLDLSTLPFPEEPVGVGAQWQQATSAQALGVAVEMISTYELVERTKTSVRVKRSVVQKAKPGAIELPGGAKVDVLSVEGTGNGELRQALNQVLPASMTFDLHARMTMKAQGQTVTQTTTATTNGHTKLAKR
jgi:hypothetical protein